MKKSALVFISILLAVSLLAIGGCTQEPATTTAPATTAPAVAPSPTPVAQGAISNVNLEKSTITVVTDKGTERTFEIDAATGFILNGDVCPLDTLDSLVQAGVILPCTVYTTADQSGTITYIEATNPADTTAISGTLTSVDAAKSTVTLMTAQGSRTFNITPGTTLLLAGQVCTLSEILPGDSTQPVSCTVYYYPDEQGQAAYLAVPAPSLTDSVTGSVMDVNQAQSTITVMTDQGLRTFDVDPSTGLFLAGQVCSLSDIAANEATGAPLSCTVYYTLDDQGQAVYVAIAGR